MGYRSTFVTEDTNVTLPQWFVDKWKSTVFIKPDHTLPIASKQEGKCYGMWEDLPSDLSCALREMPKDSRPRSIYLIFLHEDGLTIFYTIYADEVVQEYEEQE